MMTPSKRYDAMMSYVFRLQAKYALYMHYDLFSNDISYDFEIKGERITGFPYYATTGDTSVLPDEIKPMFDALEAGVPLRDILA